jgi:hypothetical protein
MAGGVPYLLPLHLDAAVRTEEYTVTDLLDMCRRTHGGFTLGEIVEAVLRERPGSVRDFARAWEELHRRGLLRIRRVGRPATYEVVTDGIAGLPPAHRETVLR